MEDGAAQREGEGMSGMKPTPKTDAMVGEEHCEGLYQRVEEYHTLADFARDLERQLSDALEREKKLEDMLQVAVDSELGAKWIWPDSAKETWMKNARELLSGDEPTYTDCPIHGRHEGDCPRC